MVLEYREDSTKGVLTVVSTERGKRPSVAGKGARKVCPFCPGSESMVPPAVFESEGNKGWSARAFPNKFAIVRLPAVGERIACVEGDFGHSFGSGVHEVIVETRAHNRLFQDFTDSEAMHCLEVYKNRFRELGELKGVESVFLFKNHGGKAGASVEHEHAQIIALPFVPPILAEEARFVKKTLRQGRCWFCRNDEYLERHKGLELAETKHFVAFCPPFGRFPFESWIVAKRHVRSFLEFTPEEDNELMKLLRRVVRAVHDVASEDYVILFHNGFKGGEMHFHVEIAPRPNVWGGLELGTGIIVNSVAGEEGVKKLRKAMK
ncbi:hypothetical protein AUJ65_06320 [Candidatus Micrarchaeota archaeon CG1_02_51_15]|nr:MAG: hypothetical protein AUJ65_06320 [Candidatus Micrarchaeota archaeon CG1_02_51_15]